jgi:O-antigen/teichoic acid export membrane protein
MQWLWVVPLLAAGMNLVQTGMLFGNRHQRYKTVAVNAITLQAAYGIAAVVMGLASLGAVGLIFGRIIGQGAAALHMWPLAHALSTAHGTKLTSRKGGYFLRRYRQFPIYNLPSTLLMTAARESLVIVFGLFGFAHAAGLAGMVRAGLLIPVGLMSASIGQVFLKQAVIHNGKRAFADFTFWLAAGLLISMTPGFAFLIAWADPIVMTILGPGWTGAGTYAALLAPVTLMQALNIWFMRVLEVTGHQHVNFRLQSVLDTGSIAGVVALLMLGHTPLTALACYACLQMVYQLLLTRAVFRYSKLSLNRFLAMIGGALAVSSLPLGLHVLFGDSTNMGAQFVREGAVMLVMTLILSVFFLARLKRAQAAYLAEPEI